MAPEILAELIPREYFRLASQILLPQKNSCPVSSGEPKILGISTPNCPELAASLVMHELTPWE